ncbi:KR domain-containing protein [Xylaria acuta]|nr:KR domain-containing protein [Xylaria acuta]
MFTCHDEFYFKASQVIVSNIQSVLAPKALGSVNLDYATKNIPLDLFLMTSPIVGAVGTPSQGAYTAANVLQDAFGRFCLSQRLPSTVLRLGSILELSSVNASIGFQQMLQRNATYGVANGHLPPTRFLPGLESGRINDLVWYNDARFGAVRQAILNRGQTFALCGSSASGGVSSLATQLHNALSPAEKLAIAREAVTTRFAELLGLTADGIDSDKPASRYGVDRLVAGGLRNWVIKTPGRKPPMLQLIKKTTRIEDLVKGAAGVQ